MTRSTAQRNNLEWVVYCVEDMSFNLFFTLEALLTYERGRQALKKLVWMVTVFTSTSKMAVQPEVVVVKLYNTGLSRYYPGKIDHCW